MEGDLMRKIVMLLVVAWASVGAAQTSMSNGSGGGVPATISGMEYTTGGFPMYTQGQPFELSETITTERMFADGSGQKMTSTSTNRAYRDSEGRFRLEMGVIKDGEWKVRSVQIFDPVALTSLNYMVGSKTARLTHVQPRQQRTAEDEAKMAAQRARSEAYRKEHPDGGGEEALGSQVLVGVVTEGTRHTMKMNAAEGQPAMTIVDEKWMSPELQIPLLSKRDHPLIGHSVTTVTELKRLEPDAGLFKLPQGYTVVEQMRPEFGP